MNRPIISPKARIDLDEIWIYIAQDNTEAADKVIDEILAAGQRLNEMPLLGHIREDLTDKHLRFWAVRSYLIVYQADKNPIEIVRVLSGHRDLGILLS